MPREQVKLWFRTLFSGMIGGGASAALASLGLAGAEVIGIKADPLNWAQIVGVFLSGSVISLLMFLKQSPLPPPPSGNEPS
jgi:hypothetical protein